jgi:uncharacterized membrane protein required for colicin V production
MPASSRSGTAAAALPDPSHALQPSLRASDSVSIMWLDVLALLLLVVFAALGARRGALATGLSLAGLVGGYAAAIFAAKHLGAAAGEALGVAPLFGAPIAGTAAFLVVAISVGLVSFVLRRGHDRVISGASRAGGALFGMLRGSLVVLLLGVLALWIDALPRFQQADGAAPADTPLRSVARAAVEAGVETALGDAPGAGAAAHLLAQPGAAIEQLRTLAAKPEITALANDPDFWAYVEADAVQAALALPSFQRIQWNGDLRRELAALGLVDEIAAGDPAIFALEMRGALETVGPRIRQIREDPELARLAADPEVADLVQRRDVLGLLAHPGFQGVLSRALAPPAEGGAAKRSAALATD